MTADSWRDDLFETLKSYVGNSGTTFGIDHVEEEAWKRIADRISYVRGDSTQPELYTALGGALDEAAKKHGTHGNAIFYLAVADKLETLYGRVGVPTRLRQIDIPRGDLQTIANETVKNFNFNPGMRSAQDQIDDALKLLEAAY